MNRLASASIAALATLTLTSCLGGDDEGVDCAQVVVWARPASGECRTFATPCDVPSGYTECCGGLFGGCVSGGSADTCVDDPTDACNPGAGATDCPGICQ
ncbi:hypothetical protein [Pyxidicoccus trucidator]|uniref:hypothetical protein n=1 Tax=Pyxidicoccus trucidator TaxID=2709662 RepID=UPI0013D927B8|nr:hypothetical protein [Pyxidicoccus trucidator]